MAARRIRSILEPAFYCGIALLLHGVLFLALQPLVGDGASSGRRPPEEVRGVRIRTFVDSPPPVVPRDVQSPPPSVSNPPPELPKELPVPAAPSVVRDQGYASTENGRVTGESGVAKGTPGASVDVQPGGTGAAGGRSVASVASDGGAPPSAYGNYLSRLRSREVQGAAKTAALQMQRGWKGSGTGEGGWGSGSGRGDGGTGGGGGGDPGGTGFGKSGKGQGGGGTAYMDPRVKMVVIRYPVVNGRIVAGQSRNIENQFRPVPYPDLKIKQSRFTAGWWNVYFKLDVDSGGNVTRTVLLRPDTDGPLEKQFVNQVKREIGKWNFEDGEAEIHVDVRFYVE